MLDLKRLELSARNMADHHMVFDIVPTVARLVCRGRLPKLRLWAIQLSILVAFGLQHKSVDAVCSELDLPSNQVLAFINKTIRKISAALRDLQECAAEDELATSRTSIASTERRIAGMSRLTDSLAADQDRDETDHMYAARKERVKLVNDATGGALEKYALDTNEVDRALNKASSHDKNANNVPTSVSVLAKRKAGEDDTVAQTPDGDKKKNKKSKKNYKEKKHHDTLKGRNCEYALRCNPNATTGKNALLWNTMLMYEVPYEPSYF